ATVEDGLEVRVGHGGLGPDGRREADPVGVQLRPHVDPVERLQEVDRLGRRVLAARDAVAAADAVGRGPGATGDGREGEPAEAVAEALLADALALRDRRRPLAP